MSLEKAISRLILDNNLFYATILQQCKRIYTTKIPSAAVSVTDTINFYVNPAWFDKLTNTQQEAVLKHECLHLILKHCIKGQRDSFLDAKKLTHKQLNIAMDCCINQMENISDPLGEIGGVTIDKFREACSDFVEPTSIKENMSFDYYASVIAKCQEKFDETRSGENIDDHDMWEEGEATEVSEAYQEHVVKDIVKKAKDRIGGSGNISNNLSVLLDKLFASKVNWRSELRKFVNNALNYTKTSSRSRRNRRYGSMYAGKKKDWEMHIAFILDTSGSMSEHDLAQGWSEMAKIQEFYPNLQITLIEADTEVQNVVTFNKALKPEIKGRGGTVLTPAFKKAIELEADLIICFTDGDFYEKMSDPKIPTLFTIVGKSSWEGAGFGRSIYINEHGR